MRTFWLVALLLGLTPFVGGEDNKPPETMAAASRPQVVLEPGGHTSGVSKLFFSHDSKHLITASSDGTIRYWDTESGDLTRVLRGRFYIRGQRVAVSSDRKTMAVYLMRDTIQLIGVEDGKIRNIKLQPAPHEVAALAFSPDDTQLAIGTGAHEVFVMDVKTEKRIRSMRYLGNHAHLAFSPDGKRLASHADAEGIGILDLETGKTDLLRAGGTRFITWTPDGKHVVNAANQGIEFWDPETKRVVKKFDAGTTTSIHWLPKENGMLTTGTQAKVVKARCDLLDARTGKERFAFTIPAPWKPHPMDADASPDGKLVATASGENNAVHIWRRSDGVLLHSLRGKGTPQFAAGWHNDGNAIAWGWSGRAEKNGNRPLLRAFDLTQLQFLPKPDAKDYRRAVRELEGNALHPNLSSVIREDKKRIDVQIYGSAESHLAGTLLPDKRVLFAKDQWLYYYDFTDPGSFEKARNGYFMGLDKALGGGGFSDDGQDVAPSPNNRFVVTASRDQVLRVWQVTPKKLYLQLSMFVAGQDWIVWTPQGYYAASPGGEHLMGWKIDNGPNRLASFYPAERFRKRLYRPDVIKLVLQKGSVGAALKAADAALEKETGVVAAAPAQIEELLPPRVTLSIDDRSKLPEVKFKVDAKAGTKAQPIQALRLLVNGRPLPDRQAFVEYRDGKAKADPEWTVTLPSGKHQVSVLARSADASSLSNEIEIDCVPLKEKPVLHVLAVGVNEYKDKDLNLKCAANDAEGLSKAFAQFSKGEVFGEVSTTLLINKDATSPTVLKAVEELRTDEKKKVKDNDVVVVFFAGHGATKKNAFYLLTHEADLDDLDKTALSGAKLREALGAFPCQVLLVMDACHAGAFGGTGKLTRQEFKPATDAVARSMADSEVGVAVMCAAMGYERSEERSGNGLFTKALIEALSATEEVPHNKVNGRQYVHHLQTFVFDRVSAVSGEKQHPFLHMPWTMESFALRKLPAKKE